MKMPQRKPPKKYNFNSPRAHFLYFGIIGYLLEKVTSVEVFKSYFLYGFGILIICEIIGAIKRKSLLLPEEDADPYADQLKATSFISIVACLIIGCLVFLYTKSSSSETTGSVIESTAEKPTEKSTEKTARADSEDAQEPSTENYGKFGEAIEELVLERKANGLSPEKGSLLERSIFKYVDNLDEAGTVNSAVFFLESIPKESSNYARAQAKLKDLKKLQHF